MAKKKRVNIKGGVPAGVLNPMQRKAVEFYFTNGFHKGNALRSAGYAELTSTTPGSVFNLPHVRAEMKRRQEAMSEKYELTEDWIIQRVMAIANTDATLAKFKLVQPDGSLVWDFTGATEAELSVIAELTTDEYMEGRGPLAKRLKKFKINPREPMTALLALMKFKGMLVDRLKLDGDINLVERLQKGRERIAKPAE